jgi:hypothetical protein
MSWTFSDRIKPQEWVRSWCYIIEEIRINRKTPYDISITTANGVALSFVPLNPISMILIDIGYRRKIKYIAEKKTIETVTSKKTLVFSNKSSSEKQNISKSYYNESIFTENKYNKRITRSKYKYHSRKPKKYH